MKAFLSLVVVLALASTTMASHFRYHTLSWSRASATDKTIEVSMQQAWRWSAFGNPAVGTTVSISSITWGDGTSSSFAGTVVSTNAADDWFFIEISLTHTYPALSTYTIQYSDCCRIGGLLNGNSGNSELVRTTVVLSAPVTSSPKLATLPIIPFQINHDNSIKITALPDDTNSPITFSIVPASDSGLSTAIPSPSGVSLPFALTPNGYINWHPTVAGLYAFQAKATAANGNAVTVDVILSVGTAQADTTAPYWTKPSTGDITIHYVPGALVTFDVEAKEDEIDNISVNAAAIPVGATLSGCQGSPVAGRFNPCTTTFSWQSAPTDGDSILCFQAKDDANNYATPLCVSLIADVPNTNACTGGNCAVKSVAASCSVSGSTVSHSGTGKCVTLSFAGTSTQC